MWWGGWVQECRIVNSTSRPSVDLATITEAFPADLKDRFLSAIPGGLLAFDAPRVRLKHEIAELPAPRLEILPGEPKRFPQMDGTARLPVSLRLVTDYDASIPDQHRSLAGKLDGWWRGIRTLRKQTASFSRCFLHDFLILQPLSSRNEEKREQVTEFRAEAIVTLFTEPQLL